jgi:SAM-dependent methyltransferase
MSGPVDDVPPNRWETTYPDAGSPYARTFEDLLARGEDVDGEARLADVLLPRSGGVLDAGSGLGRVAAALQARGHDVTAVEKDPDLVARSHRLFPDVPVVVADILELTPSMLEAHGRPSTYDLVVAVGNVVVYLADGTETRALRTLADLLVPGGRVLLGWHPQQGPPGSRDYPVELFREHLAGTGLEVEHVFGGYDLAPPTEDYVVVVLRSGRQEP